jgi:hypothetical protein
MDELIQLNEAAADLPNPGRTTIQSTGCSLFVTSMAIEVDKSVQRRSDTDCKAQFSFAPTLDKAKAALHNIAQLISPYCRHQGSSTKGHKEYQGSNIMLQRLIAMENHLKHFIIVRPPPQCYAKILPPAQMSWQDTAKEAAINACHGPLWAQKLC